MRSGKRYAGGTRRRPGGFTLLEMLVVMALTGLLLTLAVPRYFQSLQHAREEVLVHNLIAMRTAIGRFHVDKGRFPDDLNELVEKGYLRALPSDPIAETNAAWITVAPEHADDTGVADVRSGAEGEDSHGVAYADL
jgi:general secretion pathway protein G